MNRKLKNPVSVLAIVLISLWVSIGSADPESATAPAEAQPDSLALTDESEESSDSEIEAGTESAESETASEAAQVEEAVAATVEREAFGVEFDLISTNAVELTELQFDEWAAGIEGTEIGWRGSVTRVEETLFDEDDFQVVVDVEGGSFGERANLLLDDRDLALTIPADIDVFFTGTIDSVSNVIGVTVDVTNVQIEDSDGNVFEAAAADSTTEEVAAEPGDPSDFETWSTNAEEMTDIQFDDWASQFIGTQFSWTGEVQSVDESLFGDDFEIVLDIEGGDGLLERSRLLVTREEALTVPANSDVSFTGTLTEADNLISLSLTFDNVSFTIN